MNIDEQISEVLKIAGINENEIIPTKVWHPIVIKELQKSFPKMIIKDYDDEMLINGNKNTYSIKITDYFWHNQQKFMMVNIDGIKRKYKTLDDFINHLNKDVEYFFVEIGEYDSLDELK